MSDPPPKYSDWLIARVPNDAARDRVDIAKRRIQSVLDTHTVSHQKTLEQKISDQGPKAQRVDPHLVGYAIKDLVELNRLRIRRHPATGAQHWYSNPATPAAVIQPRLERLAPLYAAVSGHGFGNLTGDALELIVFKCLEDVFAATPRHAYLGQFDLMGGKIKGRYPKTDPPNKFSGRSTTKAFDFIQIGYDFGAIGVECKNYREWIYPSDDLIRQLIIKANDLSVLPLLVARRVHFTTRLNLLTPAGTLFHESLFQYYPADQTELAEQARDKSLLGFSDIDNSERPHNLTQRFFRETLPRIADSAFAAWTKNRPALVEYATEQIDRRELYRAIDSPAAPNYHDEPF